MAKACEECTQNCLVMHKKNKNPASVMTTFFKVLIGEDYSKLLLLPPVFARHAKKLVDKTTHLVDLNGEKWDVKFTKIDNSLAFKDGWNKFALAHGLRQGDFLVFHYIMKSHFVVFMFGPTGFPENRHFMIPHHPKKNKKNNNNNLVANGQSPSEVLTNCNNFSHESCSKSEPFVNEVSRMKTSDKKKNNVNVSPNKNAANTQHLVASSSQPLDKEPEPLVHNTDKETDQRIEPLVENSDKETDQRFRPLVENSDKETDQRFELLVENSDKETDQRFDPLVEHSDKETDQRFEPLVENSDKETDQRSKLLVENTDKETDQRSEPLVENTDKETGDWMVYKRPKTSNLGDNSNMHEQDECRKQSLQPVVVESHGGQKNNVAAGGGGLDEIYNKMPESLKARLARAAEKRKEENIMRQSEVSHVHKRPRPDEVPCTPPKVVKLEPETLVSRMHDRGYTFTSAGISKSMAKHMETIKKEPTMNHGSGGLIKKEPTSNHGSDGVIKREPKLEPVDYDEAPVSESSNTSFSAVMSNYQYLELPSWVKLKSRVILLRNGSDLWAVLYQTKYGLKALTQNWGTFANAKGIKIGDKCEFVLESEPNSRFTCSVFNVHTSR